MLRNVVYRAAGSANTRLHGYAAGRAEQELCDLFAAATRVWAATGFCRYDDTEIACTVRFYHFCDLLKRRSPRRWTFISVDYDAAVPTDAVRRGAQNPKQTPRPDMTVTVGVAKMRVEAKILSCDATHVRNYVNLGMDRFTSGYYLETGWPAAMLGYVLSDPPLTAIADVNGFLARATPTRGQLVAEPQPAQRLHVHTSEHPPLKLNHFTVEMR